MSRRSASLSFGLALAACAEAAPMHLGSEVGVSNVLTSRLGPGGQPCHVVDARHPGRLTLPSVHPRPRVSSAPNGAQVVSTQLRSGRWVLEMQWEGASGPHRVQLKAGKGEAELCFEVWRESNIPQNFSAKRGLREDYRRRALLGDYPSAIELAETYGSELGAAGYPLEASRGELAAAVYGLRLDPVQALARLQTLAEAPALDLAPDLRSTVFAQLTDALREQGRLQEALEAAESAIGEAEIAGAPGPLFYAHAQKSSVHMAAGHFEAALQQLERAIPLAVETSTSHLAHGLSRRGYTRIAGFAARALSRGELEDGIRDAERALSMGLREGHAERIAHAALNAAWGHGLAGRAPEARALLSDHAERLKHPSVLAFATLLQAELAPRPRAQADLARKARLQGLSTGRPLEVTFRSAVLEAEAELEQGRLMPSHAALERGLNELETTVARSPTELVPWLTESRHAAMGLILELFERDGDAARMRRDLIRVLRLVPLAVAGQDPSALAVPTEWPPTAIFLRAGSIERGIWLRGDRVMVVPQWDDARLLARLLEVSSAQVVVRGVREAAELPSRVLEGQPLALRTTLAFVPYPGWKGAQGASHGYDLVVADPESDLPYARIEAAAIASPRARLALGPEATLRWLEEGLGQARAFHFAGHAEVDPQLPFSSHLRLADGARFTVAQILELAPRLDRVVLSGCATGLDAAFGPRDAVSLPSALLLGGVRSVVATIGRVPDGPMARWMMRFYRHLESADPPEAFRETQRWAHANREPTWRYMRFFGSTSEIP